MTKTNLAGLVLLTLLFFIWPVPHTIAARETLLWLSLLFFGFVAYRRRAPLPWAELRWPALAFGLLTLWIVIGALWVSDETRWSLGEIRGQWAKGIAALLVGAFGAAVLAQAGQASRLLTALAAVLMLQVLFIDLLALKGLFTDGAISRRLIILGAGPDKSNYVVNMMLVVLLAETFVRATGRPRVLRLPTPVLAAFIGAGLFGEYVTSMRNGLIELTLILVVLLALFLAVQHRRFSRVALATGVVLVLVVLGVLGYLNYRMDPRWQKLVDTIPLALDTRTHLGWLDEPKYGLPTLPDGSPVEGSAYQRIAAIKVGSELVLQYPLGVGFGRNAYGHALRKQYETPLGHSHSGIIDLAVGTGIPGVLLWLAFLGSLLTLGWRRFRAQFDLAPLLLLLVVAGYCLRMLIDSIIRDHMLQQFLFLVGVFAVLSVSRTAGSSPRMPQ
jgi:hypothetical protein